MNWKTLFVALLLTLLSAYSFGQCTLNMNSSNVSFSNSITGDAYFNIPSNTFDNIIINFGDGTSWTNFGWSSGSVYHKYHVTGSYNVTVNWWQNDNSCNSSTSFTVTVHPANGDYGCCNTAIAVPGFTGGNSLSDFGTFKMDDLTGEIVFESVDCPIVTSIDCFSGAKEKLSMPGVVKATASVFSDYWPYEDLLYGSGVSVSSDANDFERGIQNKWRVQEQYVYREELDAGIVNTVATDDYKNFDRGTFSMTQFDWDRPWLNDPEKWVRTNMVNSYTPNGAPREEENLMGIKSTALYGYNHTLPIAVAQNAEEETIVFESFENKYTIGSHDYFENLVMESGVADQVTDKPHTGNYSMKWKPSSYQAHVISDIPHQGFKITDKILSEGLVVRAWFWVDPQFAAVNPTVAELGESGNEVQLWFWNQQNSSYNWWNDYNQPVNMSVVAKAGEWVLVEGVVTSSFLTPIVAPAGTIIYDRLVMGIHMEGMQYTSTTTAPYDGVEVYMDDVRIQPLGSEMVSYVYDDAQRIVASFDDQHFAAIYQYNEAGELIRKLKETKNGIKVISETQYNTRGTFNW